MYGLHCIIFLSFLQLFLEAAEECCKIHNVQPTEFFLNKMIQTYEMMIVRHGYVAILYTRIYTYMYVYYFVFKIMLKFKKRLIFFYN